MKEKQGKAESNAFLWGLLSFAIPLFVVCLAFWSNGIYPGSPITLLTYDLRFQLFPFYGYLSQLNGPGFDNLLYSMSGGLGGGFFGTLALYLSPFDFVYGLVPQRALPDAVYFMVLVKIGACGYAMHLFLKKNGRIKLSSASILILSSCYSLMSYNIMYYVSPMWYDAVICLPLIALSLEKIIKGKKSRAFILLMAFCIISDYYMAYMVAIALVIYCLFRSVEEGFDLNTAIKRLFSLAVHGIIAGGMSLFVIIPVTLDLGRGKLAEDDIAISGAFIKNTLVDVFRSFMPQSYSGVGYDASPNVFCGSMVLIAALLWLLYGKKSLRSRISGFLIMVLYILSFIFGPLDRVWHGFRDPVCFSCRYAFTFVFFMICFAARGIEAISGFRARFSQSLKNILIIVLCIFAHIELYANSSFILSCIGMELGYTARDEYNNACDLIENLVPYSDLSDPEAYGRLVSDINFSSNDNALFGYDGIDRFSSSYNINVSRMFKSFGMDSINHTIREEGITPPVAGLVSAKYIISDGQDMSYVYTPVSSYNGYVLYRNESALPLAFETGYDGETSLDELEEDPFENVNTFYSDLIPRGDLTDVFVPQDYSVLENSYTAEGAGDTYKFLAFTPRESGHYFMYSEYSLGDEILRVDPDAKQYSYCFDVGELEAGLEYNLCLETDGSEAEKIWIYYFDTEAYKKASDSVNGYNISSVDGSGICLEGVSESDGSVVISIPYEDGYKVYVDGKKTAVDSYRDCFLRLSVSTGEHVIQVKYYPSGIIVGIVSSLLFILVFSLYFFVFDNVSKNNEL